MITRNSGYYVPIVVFVRMIILIIIIMHKKNVNLLDEIEGGAIEFNLSLSLLLLFI